MNTSGGSNRVLPSCRGRFRSCGRRFVVRGFDVSVGIDLKDRRGCRAVSARINELSIWDMILVASVDAGVVLGLEQTVRQLQAVFAVSGHGGAIDLKKECFIVI